MTKMKFKRNHIIGCVLAFIGLALVGGSNFLTETREEDKNSGIGIALMAVSIIFAGMMIGYQQRLFTYSYIEPLKMVGFEGFYGIIYCLIGIAVMSYVSCPFDNDKCVCKDGEKYFENTSVYFS